MTARPAPSSAVQTSRRPSVQSGGSKTPDVWTDSPDRRPEEVPAYAGYELIRALPASHGCAALLYRRAPKATRKNRQVVTYADAPTGLFDPPGPEAVRQALEHLTPETRRALGFPDPDGTAA